MFYSLTLTKNTREGFSVDQHALRNVLNNLCLKYHAELSDIGWELTKHRPHLLHCHLTICCTKQPYMKRLVGKGISCKLDKLKTAQDVNRWIQYCHKADSRRDLFTIQDDYEDSMVPKLPRLK